MISGTETVTPEDVRRVAELANLQLTPEEELRMRQDLNAILGHIAQLNQLDTTDIPPMSQVSDLLTSDTDPAGQTLRLDAVRPSVDRRAVMVSAPETDGRFFKVPKVIER